MDAIARELRTSRSTVSRLLSMARETGLVQIQIKTPADRAPDLERVIRKRYKVEVHVVPVSDMLSEVRTLREEGKFDERPAHEVCFEEPFWIDVHEVTNAQFAAFGGQAAQDSRWPDTVRPRQNVTWPEAEAFCEQRGARLPTEAEWEYAARGPSGLIYPWGNEFVAAYAAYSLNRPASVGSRPSGVSWVGALDMSGNIAEWVNDWYVNGYYATLANGVVNPQGPDSGWLRVLRGGSWDQAEDFLRTSYRNYGPPAFESAALGFRCALSYAP